MTTRHLKIAHVIARLNVGGPAVAVVVSVEGLRQRGHDVSLLSGEVSSGEASMEYLAQEIDLPITRIASMSNSVSWWKDLVSLCQLWRIFRREKPQVVHTHTAKAGTLGRLAAMFAGVPVRVHMFHGHVFRGYFPLPVTRIIVRVERWLARSCDCIVAISDSQKRELVDEFRIAPEDKVLTIPLGFDLAPFLSVNSREASGTMVTRCSARRQVGWVGRFVPIKDPELFIESAALLQHKFPEVHCVMTGDGELRPRCEAAIVAKHLQNQVTILGWRRHLEEVYADMDVLVLTSVNEGTPVVMLEAMAAGRAVVAVDVGGVRDLMSGTPVRDGQLEIFGNGILTARSPDSLVDAISYLLGHEALRQSMGVAGRDLVQSRYSKERMIQNFELLYSKLLLSKSACPMHTQSASGSN